MSITRSTVQKSIGLGIPLLLILVVAINARDEPLSPEAAAFAAESGPDVADPENAFFAALGFASPPGQDPHAQGMQAAARYEAALAQRPYFASADNGVRDLTAPEALSTATPIGDLICSGDGCRQQRQQKTGHLAVTLNANKAMLARYERLQAYPHYRDALTPTIFAPGVPFGVLGSAHQLLLAKVVLFARYGDPGKALATLKRDTFFWRMVLRDADSLIARVVAARFLTNNANLLSELATQYKWSAGALQEKAQAIVLPLTVEERDPGPALRREFRMNRHLFAGFAKDPAFRRSLMNVTDEGAIASGGRDILYRLFYRPEATANAAYRDFASLVAVMGLPAREFIKHLPATGAAVESSPSLIRWNLIYNPLGKVMLASSPPDPRKIAAQLHNLDGLLRLVALQLRAKQEGLAPGRMEDFLRSAGDAFANPYTGGPMQYDAEGHRFYFLGVDDNLLPVRRMEVRL